MADGDTESTGEFAPGPATKVLVALQEAAYLEAEQNGTTPTLDRPYPALRLLWQRVRSQMALSGTDHAVQLRDGWADADRRYGGRRRSSFLHMEADEAFERLQLIEDFLAASGWTDLKARQPDSLVPLLTKEELEVSR